MRYAAFHRRGGVDCHREFDTTRTEHHGQRGETVRAGVRPVRDAGVLVHLADPTRLHLLRLLRTEQDVSTLTARVAACRSSVSQHLGRLRLAGLVQGRRAGGRMLYRITSDHLADLVTEALDYA
jgi:hypothetical protein